METMIDRVLQLLKDKRVTKTELAKQLGLPFATLNNWFVRSNYLPNTRVVEVAEVLGVTPNFLYGVESGIAQESNRGCGINKVHHIPFYDVRTKMGEGSLTVEELTAEYLAVNTEQSELLNRFNITAEQAKDYFLCTVAGDSMAGTIENGDACLMKHCDQMNGDGIYLLNTPNGIICKRLQTVNDCVQVISDNTVYPSYFIEDSSTKVIGKLHCSLNVIQYG